VESVLAAGSEELQYVKALLPAGGHNTEDIPPKRAPASLSLP
jgi:hypothetical protein